MILRLLLFSCLVAWTYCGSPDKMGLRHIDNGAVPDLIEPTDPSTEPRHRDLNATILSALLGPALDPNFSSITRPSKKDLTTYFPFRRNKRGRIVPVGTMPQYIKDLPLGYLRLSDGTKIKTRVPNRLRRKLRQILWALTDCTVIEKWRDLGPRFWPRFLKEGHCPVSSCSVPAGMQCQPSSNTYKTLLRWHCRKHCQWIKIQYPVVVRCSCSCSNSA